MQNASEREIKLSTTLINRGEEIQRKQENLLILLNKKNINLELLKNMKSASLELNDLKLFYKDNRDFRKLINELANNGSRRIIKGTFATILVGGGVYVAEEILNSIAKNKNAKSGCWRTYSSSLTNNKHSCLIVEASCGLTNLAHTGVPLCTEFPNSINFQTWNGWTNEENSVCRSCNPLAQNTSKQYLSRKDFIQTDDIYECTEPVDLLDVFLDVAKNLPSDIWEGIHSFIQIVWQTLQIIGVVVLFFGLCIFVFKCKDIFVYLKNKIALNKEEVVL